MDKQSLLALFEPQGSQALLEVQRFGYTSVWIAWIEVSSFLESAGTLKASEFCLDKLENLSIVEFENIFIVSYFLASSSNLHRLIVRLSVLVPDSLERISLPSVLSIWPMAFPMETEISELFGVSFEKDGLSKASSFIPKQTAPFLKLGFVGFPLRKNFISQGPLNPSLHAEWPLAKSRGLASEHKVAAGKLEKRLKNIFLKK